MMDVKTEKTFVVRMNAEEAGVMFALLGMISGSCDSLGRAVTDAMRRALENAGAVAIDAFDGDTEIAAKDIGASEAEQRAALEALPRHVKAWQDLK